MSRLFRRIIKFLRRLFNVEDDGPAAPRAGLAFVAFTIGENGMGKLVVTVAHPLARVDGSPFNPAVDLQRWILYARAVGATNWTQVGGDNAHGVTVQEVNNVPLGGDWEVRVEWYDQHNQSSFFTTATDVPDPIPAPPQPGSASVVFVP